MEFMKKNWSKIVLSVLSLLGAIAFLVALIDKLDTKAEIGAISFDIMGIIFFLGTIAYLVCKMLDKKDIAKYVLLATGAINFIFLCIFLFGPVHAYEFGPLGKFSATGLEMIFGKKVPLAMQGFLGKTYGGLKLVATQVGFSILAALFPLVKGVKKSFFDKDAATK